MKVVVLKGGRSLERGLSLRSGARVEDALERLGHEVVPIDVGTDTRPAGVFDLGRESSGCNGTAVVVVSSEFRNDRRYMPGC